MYSAPFDAHPPPLSSCLLRHGIVRGILQIAFLLSNWNYCWRSWRRCHHKVATLMDLHFFVPSACRTRAIFLIGKGARANRGGVHDGGALFDVRFLWRSTDSSVAGSGFSCCWVTTMAERRRLGPRQLRPCQYLVTIRWLGFGCWERFLPTGMLRQ
jgi:hypothetical protein